MNNPKISIIIPVYNGSNYVRDAIECALSQTYENTEIIVINDGSTDNGKTEEIALSYGKRIRYFSKTNGGVSSALNHGIKEMTGEYFSWLSHDDMYTPEKIKDAVELLKRHEMLGKKCIAFTGGYYIDANGKKIKDFPRRFEANRIYSGYEAVNVMTRKGTLNGCCMLIPKLVFEDVGEFEEGLRYSQDSLMWYKMFLAGYSLVSDNLSNVMNRIHRNQVSQLRRDLFEHDSLVIAKILAAPLANVDNDGKVLRQYIKKMSKYQCNETIEYLIDYATENRYLKYIDLCGLKLYKILGYFRYRIVTFIKKIFLLLRRG